jgi:hypothetical protein
MGYPGGEKLSVVSGEDGSIRGGLGILGGIVLVAVLAFVHGFLEILDAFPDGSAEVGQLLGAEDDDHDQENQYQFGRPDGSKHVNLLEASFSKGARFERQKPSTKLPPYP